ncbi:MAG: peptidylprolyl isomerase [Parvularculaceae bacterium]
MLERLTAAGARRAPPSRPLPPRNAPALPAPVDNDERTDAAPRLSTPDGRVHSRGVSSRPLAAIGRALARVARALGKLVMTVWRLAGALDAALWHGVVFGTRAIGGVLLSGAGFIGAIIVDLARWLPSRSGRAYCAASGIVLAVSSLWIIDELRRAAATRHGSTARVEAPPIDIDDPILAQIRGRYVHLSEIAAAARAAGELRDGEELDARAAFAGGFVDRFVDQRLLAAAASDAGLDRDPDVLRRARAARERVLAAAFVDERVGEAATPEAVARLYEAQRDIVRLGDEVRARHIVVETEAEAREIMAALGDGADFRRLARTRSIDRATAPLGGELGYFSREIMAPRLARAAFSTPKGERAGPFFTEHGWHVIEVLDRRRAQTVEFDAVREDIARFLADKSVNDALADLRRENRVAYFPPAPGDGAARATPAGEPRGEAANYAGRN